MKTARLQRSALAAAAGALDKGTEGVDEEETGVDWLWGALEEDGPETVTGAVEDVGAEESTGAESAGAVAVGALTGALSDGAAVGVAPELGDDPPPAGAEMAGAATGDPTATGTPTGAATGAALGAATVGAPTGAWAGAAFGAATGTNTGADTGGATGGGFRTSLRVWAHWPYCEQNVVATDPEQPKELNLAKHFALQPSVLVTATPPEH